MTTFAYRDGVLAADSAACTNTGLRSGSVRKLFRGPRNTMVATAGGAGDCVAFERWFTGGQDGAWEAKDKDAGFAALVVDGDGDVLCYGADGNAYRVDAPFFARGSGGELAMGAMAMGASAEEAIEIACRYDVWSGGPVQVERVPRARMTLLRQEGGLK